MNQKCFSTEKCTTSIVCQRCGLCLMHCECPPVGMRADVQAILSESMKERIHSMLDYWDRYGSVACSIRRMDGIR